MVFYFNDHVLYCFCQLYFYEVIATFHIGVLFLILLAEVLNLVHELIKSFVTALAEANEL